MTNNSKEIHLIVGSDSLIGGTLERHLKESGKRVVGTTRRPDAVDESHLFLDLASGVEKWECPMPVSVAVICAGITRLEDCRRDPAESKRINVEGVLTLTKKLMEQGALVIYLSSNRVFDGSKPYYSSDEPLSPMTEYGRQRAEVERRLSQWKDSVAVVRLTKVLSPASPLFSTWARLLRNGKTIYPFSDMVMAPVPLSFVVRVLSLIGDMHLSEILQISGNKDISYAKVARLGSQWLGVDEKLVQPILSSSNPDYFSEGIVKHTTLDISRLKSVLGVEPPDIHWTLKTIFTNPQIFLETSV